MQNDPIPLRASTSRETVRHKRQHFSIWGLNLQRENEEYMHGACLGCLCCLRQLARGGACPQSAATEPAAALSSSYGYLRGNRPLRMLAPERARRLDDVMHRYRQIVGLGRPAATRVSGAQQATLLKL
jgi:hypothetical protein